ncbi:glycine cleavage system protein R [Planctomyces sp. SH-PL62]|uniref:glycine cleavage system protein R n=1 Tax=Planctomyces sp. SH-PL62 TaxID=1636152 RepID=UPI00078E9CE9|nr:ACT domain-containing protein [Planctomyces sp. SH-PL62]AMV38343.1 Glycine cleavage system transcriptional repressor [Planctomyces sp. SH-PL62]
MPRNFVLTLTGPDRIGIVEEVTRLVLDRGGNVETSRMARLGGEFAVLMLVAVPEGKGEGLGGDFGGLADQGYKVTITAADEDDGSSHVGWSAFHLSVDGADHEGIIHEVASHLARHGISIVEMDSESAPAPTSGSPLFSMRALVLVPPEVEEDWTSGLKEIGWRMNLEIDVEAAPDDEAGFEDSES